MRILIVLCILTLCACSGTRDKIKNIGKAPPMNPIENPTVKEGYQPVSLPMPTKQISVLEKNSLWDSNRSTFFKDQRATNIGDILTVLIDIKDEATLDNATERTRDGKEEAGMASLLGFEAKLPTILPDGVNNANLIGADSKSSSNGSGTIERKEDIALKVAALITQMLPNGNMVIHGNQEVLVNFEKRVLQIDGVIRPQDVSTANTISYEQIAEARIVYGGQGQITDAQKPRYGQQFYDIIFPF